MKMSAHLNTPHDVWNNILWTDKTRMEMFSYKIHHHTGENQRHHISTNCAGGVIIGFAGTGAEQLSVGFFGLKAFITNISAL